MLYSGKYGYYKFPHGQTETGETPEQALCRIVSAQTGLSVLPESIRPCCNVMYHPEDSGTQAHFYYGCKVSGTHSAAAPDGEGRFLLKEISRRQALTANKTEDHGILAEDARFQAMLNRENLVLHSLRIFTPLMLSIFAVIGSLLIPVIGGLSCLIFGFHSPTDGGYVYGMDAFEVGLILGIFPAGPALAVSIAALLLSLRDKRRGSRKKNAYVLPLIALALLLLYAMAAAGFGNR